MPQPSPSPLPGSPVALAWGGALGLAGAMGIGRFIYTPLLPVMVEELGLTKTQAGLIASANFVGYLAGALAAAAWSRRLDLRTQMLAALAVGVVTTLAMAATPSVPAFLLWRGLGGVASAFVLVCASGLVLERLAAQGRGGLASIHFGGVGLGIVASSLLIVGLHGSGAGWRMLWLGGGVLYAAAWVAVLVLVPPSPPRPASPAVQAPGQVPWQLILSYGFFGFGYVTTATFLVAIVRGAGLPAWFEPTIWLVAGLSAMPSVAAWTFAARRLGTLPAYAAACAVEALGVMASVSGLGVPGLVLAAVLLGGTFMGLTALGLVAARSYAPRAPQRALGLMTASFGTGQIIGPLVAGSASDATGSFLLPSLLAALLLLAAALLAWTTPPPGGASLASGGGSR